MTSMGHEVATIWNLAGDDHADRSVDVEDTAISPFNK